MSFTASLTEIVAANHNGLLTKAMHWQRVRLGSVATILNGFPFPSSRFTRDRGVPLLRIRDVLDTSTDAFFVGEVDPQFMTHPGELVVGMDGDFNSSLWRGPVAALNQRVCKITPDEGALDRRFLAYLLPGYLAAINAETSAITVKHLSSKTVADIPIPLPALAEQRRIVAALEEHLSDLDAAVAGLERARHRLAVYLNASFEAAITNRLSTAKSVRSRESAYAWRPLRELIGDISQGWSPKCHSDPPATDDDWGVIKTTAIQPARYYHTESKALPAEFSPRSGLQIHVGDLLVTRKGPRTRAGVAAAVKATRPRLMICDTVYRIRLRPELARPHYMAIAMSAPSVAAAIDAAKAGISESGVSLTHDRLGAIEVPLPPIDEQEAIEVEIDRRIEAANRTGAEIDTQLARAERLRQSILKRAFEGKLVPRDPRDEPPGALARARGTSIASTAMPRGRGPRSRPPARSSNA